MFAAKGQTRQNELKKKKVCYQKAHMKKLNKK